ncbi:MAG: DUF1176 domain-containing protein [Cyanobacteria bacterium P01_G01_bin.54]
MRALYLFLSLVLLTVCPACNRFHKGWWQQQSIQELTVYSDGTEQLDLALQQVNDLYWSYAAVIQQAAELRTVETLKLSLEDEQHSNPEAIVQKLIAYPEETLKILVGCYTHWFQDDILEQLEQINGDGEYLLPEPENQGIKRRQWPVFLDPWTQDQSMERVRIHQVNKNTAVILDLCGSGGAYNLVYATYLYREQQDGITITPLVTPEYDVEKKAIVTPEGLRSNVNNDAGFMGYDPATGLFMRFRKYRGVGDCGKVTRYRLVGDRMVIQEVREDPNCGLNDLIVSLEQFPRIYP